VNIGGAVIPSFMSVYLLARNRLWIQGSVAIAAVAVVCHWLAHPVPGIGIAVPIFAPAAVTAIVSVLLSYADAAPLAYISGSLGTLIGADLLNLGADRNTRVIVFVANLQLLQGETSSAVIVNLVDINGQSYDIAAEDVRPVPNVGFVQVTFRLPGNLPNGTCTIKIKAHSQISNAGTIRIRA